MVSASLLQNTILVIFFSCGHFLLKARTVKLKIYCGKCKICVAYYARHVALPYMETKTKARAFARDLFTSVWMTCGGGNQTMCVTNLIRYIKMSLDYIVAYFNLQNVNISGKFAFCTFSTLRPLAKIRIIVNIADDVTKQNKRD